MGVPLSLAPLAYALLLLIPAVSLYGLFMDRGFIESGIFHVRSVRTGRQYHRMLTPALLHADMGHLFVNMLTLYFFGPAVEAVYGTTGFILIFLAAQAGAQGYTLYAKRHEPDYRALGASGAVSGIVLAFCVFKPMQPLYLFFAIPIPAFLFAILYIAYSTYSMRGTGRIAHEAHLGGAIAGAAMAFLLPHNAIF